MLGKIRSGLILPLPFRMNKNNISQAKSYINIFKTETDNKDNDHSIVIIIIMINIAIYIDKKEV